MRTGKIGTVLITLVAAATFPLVCPSPSRAGAPTDQIRLTVDRVLLILKDSSLNSDGKKNERREQLRKAIFPRFDFEEMAKRSLGSHWRRRTAAEQKEFVTLFTHLVQDSYVTSIESYRGERVSYNRENLDGSYAEVGTAIFTHRGQEFSIDYRLHLVERQWKVYDVVIEHVSIVNNFRSQFNRVIGRTSYKELLRVLKEKQN